MSVDRTIEELSGTLAQLGILVEHINVQIVGISSRVNVTLENFDRAVEGIAKDAGLMIGQVGYTVAQVPSSWVFYVLIVSLIVVLALFSVLILLILVERVRSIYRDCSGVDGYGSPANDHSDLYYYGDSKQSLSPRGANAPQVRVFPMNAEPKRYGNNSGFSPPPLQLQAQPRTGGMDNDSYASPSRASPSTERFLPSSRLTHRQPHHYPQQSQQQQHYFSPYAARQPPTVPASCYIGQSPTVRLAQQQRYGTGNTAVMSRTDSDTSQLSANRMINASPRAEAV